LAFMLGTSLRVRENVVEHVILPFAVVIAKMAWQPGTTSKYNRRFTPKRQKVALLRIYA
jgi:hypothetical protein